MIPEEVEAEISRLEHLEILRERQRAAAKEADAAALTRELYTLDYLVIKHKERAQTVLNNYYALHKNVV
jgi:hypothetical protein